MSTYTYFNDTEDENHTICNLPDDFTQSNLPFQLIIGSFYLVILLLGVFGNALVCFVVVRNRQMQTVTNLFITNLALSDVLLCLLGVPFTPLYTFLGSWIFGDVLCHLVPYAQGASIYISSLTLTSIAVDRFLVILYPFKPRMKIGVCLGIVVAIWSVALLLTLPYGWYMNPKTGTRNDVTIRYCEEDWPTESFRMVFSSLTCFLQFVLPFIIITFCYECVSARLVDQARMKPGHKSKTAEEVERERKRKTNRMLIAMVGIFGISWLPLNIFNLVEDFYPGISCWKYYKVPFFIAHSIAMSSTCYNPFLYAWLNENFRKEFKQVLPCFQDADQQNQHDAMDLQRIARRGTESCGHGRIEQLCNGTDERTVQDGLLASSPQVKRYSGCQMISLEPTTNLTKLTDCEYRPQSSPQSNHN